MGWLIARAKNMTAGGWAGFLAVVVLVGLGLFVAGARWVNTSPNRCATCHPVLTELWRESQGHPADRVTCYQCHARHAELPESANAFGYVRDRLIPEGYAAFEERVEARCEGCHTDIRSKTEENRKLIRINHKVHLAKTDPQGNPLDLGCLDCHRSIAHDKAEVPTWRPRMYGCFTGDCHRKDRNKDNCRRCHYQHLAEPGAEVL